MILEAFLLQMIQGSNFKCKQLFFLLPLEKQNNWLHDRMVGSFPQDIQTAHLLTIPHHTSLKNLIILLLKTLVHLRLLY